jgi:hypothetical protein
MSKIGPKEAALKTLRPRGHAVLNDLVGTIGVAIRETTADAKKKNGALAPHHKAMIADGLPPKLARTGPAPKIKKPDTGVGVTLAPPVAVQKAIAADLADDKTAGSDAPVVNTELAARRTKIDAAKSVIAATKEATVSKSKKESTVKKIPAPKKVAAKKADKPKKQSKADMVEEMLLSKTGASQEELKKATGWPYTNVALAAKRAEKKLVEKDGRYRLV